jgi:hypothetical protein
VIKVPFGIWDRKNGITENPKHRSVSLSMASTTKYAASRAKSEKNNISEFRTARELRPKNAADFAE